MNLLEKNKNYKPKNFIQSMINGEWDEENVKTLWNDDCKVNLKDGEYPMVFTSYSWIKSSDIPKQKNTINITKDDKTQQFNYGVLKVKDGQIDLEEFDKQIPNDYRKYNTHIFLEDFDIVKVFGFDVIVPIFGS
jgi:hypothetical protein|tara:strand:+ start:173 stop:574 length:402 start_codon:yes stop_codon:yes gene_type:complete